MPTTDAPDGPVAASPAILQTTGLRKSYGKFTAVDALDIHVPEGKIYGFLGRNGAGKTTTIRMLMGILEPDAGTMDILGERTRRVSIRQKRSIGYMSQGQHFYPWMTCRSIGKFVGGFYPTWDAVEFSRLLAALELPPNRKIAALSQGMRVKLALALAIAHRPPLLILDEPTAGLDPVARREFLELILQQARSNGRTTYFSSHLVEEVERIADVVGILHQGRLRFEGPIGDLRDSVRRWTGDGDLPASFEVLASEQDGSSRIARAPAADWETLPPGSVELVSLEDAFIAVTGGYRARL